MDASQQVKSTFRLHGYNLNVETTKYIIEIVNEVAVKRREEFLEKMIDCLMKRNIDSSSSLTKGELQKVLQEINFSNKDEKADMLCVIDAFKVPKSVYCENTKKLIKSSGKCTGRIVNTSAEARIELFSQRFQIILQRTLRHDLFSPCVASASTGKKFQLKPIEHLLTHPSDNSDIIVLGMIAQLKENNFYLEDPSGCLPLNLSSTRYHSGIYTEGCFVLAEGSLIDGVFEVKALGFPPAELESVTRAYFGNVNYFGGPNDLSCKSSVALSQAHSLVDTMIVFLSDVWLDSPMVMEKLMTLFIGYSESPPYAFVMCGNFLSEPKYGLGSDDDLAEGFKKLANLIVQFNTIKDNCHFIFIAGPQDPGVVKVYPRAGIHPHFTEYFRKKVPHCYFPSNPCRIQFGSRQIVVFREDLLQKMSRNSMKLPDSEKLSEEFAKTLVCQAHLAPLPLHVVPIHLNYDYVMRLYPLPDLVVVADKQQAYSHEHSECTIMSPGSFPRNNFGFKVYVPSSKMVEDCIIPPND